MPLNPQPSYIGTSDKKFINIKTRRVMDFEDIIEQAENGDLTAQNMVGSMFYEMKDYKKAYKYFSLGCEKEDWLALYMIGRMYTMGEGRPQDIMKSLEYTERAANQGCARSQGILASAYLRGDIKPQNTKLALEWYKKSADQGEPVSKDALERLKKQGIY